MDKHNYDSIIFDLDGTLWSASQSSAIGWQEAFRERGFNKLKISGKDIEKVTGKPFAECAHTLIPKSYFSKDKELLKSMDHFEQLSIKKHGGILYEGVEEGLKILKKKFSLFIVSNCQEWYLKSFFAHTKLKDLFKDTECYGRTHMEKHHNIKKIITRNKLKYSVYVGDTLGDETAALKAGIDFIFMNYGFGNSTHFKHSCANFTELIDFLIK